MQVDLENSENNKCVVKVKMDKFEVDRETNAVLLSLKSHVDVPGFRKGAAPIDVIRARFRTNVLASTAEKLVYQGTADALKTKKLKNVSNPELLPAFRTTEKKSHLGYFGLDGTFTFAVSVELPPDIDVKDYTGVTINVPSTATTFNNWFEARQKNGQFMYGTKLSVNRPVQQNDELIADFEGFVAGEPLEGGKEENFRVVVGSGGMPDAFEKAFIGKSIGEEFSVSVSFPADYANEALAGKICDFKCKINEVNEVIPHEINDDFARLHGHNSLEEMKAKSHESWQAEYAQPMRAQLFNSIMEKVLISNPFDPPSAWVDKEVEMTLGRLNARGLRGNANAMTALRKLSERTVKIAFILDKIYEKETAIHLSPTEFMAIAEAAAKEHGGMSGADFIQKLKDENRYEGFVVLQEQERVIDFLINNSIKEEPK